MPTAILMRRGHKGVFKAAIAELEIDLERHEADAARTRDLIAALLARAEGGNFPGAGGNAAAVPPKKRRRRRRKSRPAIVRKAKRHAAKRGTVGHVATPAVPVAVPTPVAAKVEPTKGVRDHGKFADQLAELELVRVGIAAAGDDARIIHTLQVRGDAALREMDGKAKLPSWCSKSIRMRWRRAAAQPEAKAPRKKKPRRPTPPIPPPVVKRTDWRPDENGNLVREIITS